MKKILAIFLCICMLCSTESVFLIANAVDSLAENQVTITVNFLYHDNVVTDDKVVQNPYVARIESGHDFEDTLIPPAELGYQALHYVYADKPDEIHNLDNGAIKLNFENLTSDVVINVYYTAIQVNYSVRYFFQNLYDDAYTEEASLFKTNQAITGTEMNNDDIKLTAEEAEKAGIDLDAFTLLYFIPDKVAADGSTIFECYYDRNYYTINFELDGGYGVEPIHERYGARVVVPTPKKPGYVFEGWDQMTAEHPDGDSVADTVVSTMDSTDRTYKALWSVGTSAADMPIYSIIYRLNDGFGNYSVIYTAEKQAQAGSKVSASHDLNTVAPSEFQHYFLIEYDNSGNPKADKDVVVEGDSSTVLYVDYTTKLYTLRFYYAKSNSSGYYVVGGSTYGFGGTGNNASTTVQTALQKSYEWGKISKPTFNDNFKDSEGNNKYTEGSETLADGFTYHYIQFIAPYQSDISEIWPNNIFDPSDVEQIHAAHGGSTDQNCKYKAYFSAWNGEFKVKYTVDETNETIKGKYQYLDERLIFASNYQETIDPDTNNPIVCYLAFWENGSNTGWSIPEEYVYHIYVETLPGEKVDKTYNSVNYTLYDKFYVYDNSNVGEQTAIGLEGFEYIGRDSNQLNLNGRTDVAEIWNVNFYYHRKNEAELIFRDGYGTILTSDNSDNTNLSVLDFGSKLTYFVPPIPQNLDGEAYTFAGWYDNAEYEGRAFNFETDTMPAENLTLYAKWILVKHNVHFFDSVENANAYQNDNTSTTPLQSFMDITHYDAIGSAYTDINGESLKTPSKTIVIGSGDDEREVSLTFVGWFYMDGDTRKAYDADNTMVTDDLYVFAMWRSDIPQPYEVRFVTYVDGEKVEIADPIKDYARLGSTVTFTAKAGKPYNQLYEGYNSNYFPETQSHSITVLEGNNYYEFVYRNASTPIEYIVRVVDENGRELYSEKKETYDSVVEERYIPTDEIPDLEGYYIPDSFYKTLVISVVWDEEKQTYVGTDANVITFVYTEVPDKVGSYIVRYMMQNLDGTYSLHHTYLEDYVTIPAGTDSTQIDITVPTFAGYKQSISGTLQKYEIENADGEIVETEKSSRKKYYKNNKLAVTEEGITLILYFDRVTDLEYTVEYRKYGSNELIDSVTFENLMYGKTVTALPQNIQGYNCVTGSQSKSLTISDNNAENIITFLYEPILYQVQYFAVTFDGNLKAADGEKGGALSRTQENVAYGGEAFKTVTATPKQYYSFVGWFTDSECNESAVSYGTVSDNSFQPDINKLKSDEINTFYAKFVRLTADLTITRTNAADDQIFIYRISFLDANNNEVSDTTFWVTLKGNSSVTISNMLQGNYLVTQENEWSWRYDDAAQSIVIDGNNDNITFSKVAMTDAWLNGNSEYASKETTVAEE